MRAPLRVKAEKHREFRPRLIRAGFIGFTDHEDIGNLQYTGLDCLHFVAHARSSYYQHGLCSAHDLDLCLPRPYRLDDNRIKARCIHSPHDIARRGCESTQAATAGHAADKHVGIARQFHHADAIPQDSSAGKGAGGVNGNHADFAFAPAQFAHKMRYQRTLTRARRTGYSNDMSVACMLVQFCQVVMRGRSFVFDKRYHTRKRATISVKETFNDVLQSAPTPRSSDDRPGYCYARTQ